MKLIYKINTFLCGTLLCTGISGCSSGDEGNNDFSMSQLVGSEWESKYEWIEEDGDHEKGTSTLTFTSSSSVTEHIVYSGEHWDFDYDLGIDVYEPYHGERDDFYSYTVSGEDIIINYEFYDRVLHRSGNKLIEEDGDNVWTLIKAGNGNDEGGATGESYSWSDMQGVWLGEPYELYEGVISQYQDMNMSSDYYYRDSDYGNFQVGGFQFNSEGYYREVDVQMKAFHNSGKAVLKTIHTSDGETVYWTDVSYDDYSGLTYNINGNKIYYNGQVIFEIINKNTIREKGTDYTYIKAQ